MRYFIDTEFSERGPHQAIDLISIGLVAEDGREFYAVSTEFDSSNCSAWVQENVLPHLPHRCFKQESSPRIKQESFLWMTLDEIKSRILEFIGDTKPEFWGYYADYDWVVFCQTFGTMVDLPKGWPMYCRDLKQWCVQLGNPSLPKQISTEHNALNDARWNKAVWEFLHQRESCGVKA